MLKVCAVCGEQFETNNNKQIYCGEKCRRKVYYPEIKKRVYERNKKSMKKYKEIALINYDCKCAICGWSFNLIPTLSCGCDVHHIIPCSSGGGDGLDNVIVLCPNHHKTIHIIQKKYGTEKVKEYLSGFIKILSKEELEEKALENTAAEAIERLINGYEKQAR